jgi:uncharacterized repeat protein (TIGR03803 family)
MSIRISPSKRRYSASALVVALAALSFGTVLAVRAAAADEQIIYNFSGSPDGSSPLFNLMQDGAGNLYGITFSGGVYGPDYTGTAFQLSQQNGVWRDSVLHSFGGPGDTSEPNGTLIMDKAGNLYGVADYGNGGRIGDSVYELSPDGQGNWTETILKTWEGQPAPIGSLALDAAGNLYGVNQYGGGTHCQFGCGVVFELSPPVGNAKKRKSKWTYTILYRFQGPKYGDGAYPNGSLIFDAAGNLYGTTQYGGAYGKGKWNGNVFELSPGLNGWTEKILYSFGGYAADAAFPNAGLIFDEAGNLYGTTFSGGSYEWGTAFELSPKNGSWTESVIYSFLGLGDGGGPWAPVTLHNGNLYGTTFYGGNQPDGNGDGVVFELTPAGGSWTENVLYTFAGPPDDGSIQRNTGVMFDSSGNLYGLARGGANGYGFVYEIPQ